MRLTTKRFIFLTACLVLASTRAATADYAAAVLADSPLGYWRMNDTGDTAANDGTEGSAYDGSYFDGARVPVESFTLADGRAVSLGAGNTAFKVGDAPDEYMSVDSSLMSDLGQFTMTAWVNPGTLEGNRIGLFGQNDVVEFGFSDPNTLNLWTPTGQTVTYNVSSFPDDTWYHLGAVGDGTSIRLFINGEPTQAGPPGYGVSSFDFNIAGGGVYDATGNQFTGTVDEVAMWQVALDESQIQAHVAAGKAADGDYAASVLGDAPVGYWRMNDADGTTAANSGTGGPALNGVYNGGDRSAAGPNETYGGFGTDNLAFGAEAPDDGFISVSGSPLSSLKEFTLSGWVKPGFIVDNRVGLFGQNDALEFGFINPTTIQMWSPGGGAVDVPIDGYVFEDEWVHIAAVGDGEEIRVYIDGEEVGVGGGPIDLGGDPVDSYGTSDYFFNVGGGGIWDATGNQFTGQIDEVAMWDIALTDAQILTQFQAALANELEGDFNLNRVLDQPDIDDLTTQSAGMMNPKPYDLNNDDLVNEGDVTVWINDLFKSWVGDANLDGEFNTNDLVTVLASGTYEIDTAAVWSTGDFNGDGRANTGDLVFALAGGGYEAGPRAAVSAVPEPSTCILLGMGALLLIRRRRK